ncbi:MAG TPA: CAP domain-containing protein [Candidatus Methylacidiphilales bacterium]|jgi:uncharacterized protein YkwD|nr:CAP domain-containing protein [Candidatus Methylacidiphilales bacterium]
MSATRLVTRFPLILAFLALAAFSGVEAQQANGSAPAATGADYRSGVELETFSLINHYRQTNGLPPLAWNDAIAKAARVHSKDMATGEVDFGHEGFADRVGRLKAVMTGLRGAGENVFMTTNLDQVARIAVTRWLHSPHHLENIRGDYNYSGLGVWQDKAGTIYFTQIFLKIAPPEQEAEAAPPSMIAL